LLKLLFVDWCMQLHEELNAAEHRRHQHPVPYVGISTSSSSSSAGLTSHHSSPHLALAAPAPRTVMLPEHHVVHPVVSPSIPDFTVRLRSSLLLLLSVLFDWLFC